jgi:hypothetical protein
MKSGRRAILLLFAALCVGLGWQTWREHREVLDLREAREAQSKAEIQERGKIEQLRRQVAELRSETNAPGRHASGESSGESKNRNPTHRSAAIDITHLVRQDPAYAAVHRKNLLQGILMRYGDLKVLNLPPDRLEKLEDILIDEAEAPQDAREAALEMGVDADSQEMTNTVWRAQKEADSEIKSFLGDADYQTLQASQSQIQGWRSLEWGPNQELTALGVPLSVDQMNALLQFQNAAQSLPTQEARGQMVISRATQVLTPDQLGILTQYMDTQREIMELQNRAVAAANKQYGPGPTTLTGP